MNCKNCGTEIKDGFLFCMNCGKKIEEADKITSAAEGSALDTTVSTFAPAPEQTAECDSQQDIFEKTESFEKHNTFSMFSADGQGVAPAREQHPDTTMSFYGSEAPVSCVPEDNQPQQETVAPIQEPAPQQQSQPQPVWNVDEQMPYQVPVENKPKKKKKGVWVAIVAAVLAIGILGFLLCASFSPIQVISSQNSPVQDLVDAYLQGELDGYAAEVKIVTTYEGEEPSVSQYEYAYGALDLETDTREFTMRKYTGYSGYQSQTYETPEWYYNNSIRTSSYSGEYESGHLKRAEGSRAHEAEFLKALSAKNYRELAAYINRNYYNYPMLDEGGFDKCMRKLNRQLKDDDYFNDIFGYERDEHKGVITYTFEFEYLEVMEWFLSVLEENPDAFRSEEKHQLVVDSFRERLENKEKEYKKDYYTYEIEIEDGYIISMTKEREYIRISDVESERVGKVKTEYEYSDHGEASVDKEVLSGFKDRKSELGSDYMMDWYKNEVIIYDEDYSVVRKYGE